MVSRTLLKKVLALGERDLGVFRVFNGDMVWPTSVYWFSFVICRYTENTSKFPKRHGDMPGVPWRRWAMLRKESNAYSKTFLGNQQTYGCDGSIGHVIYAS